MKRPTKLVFAYSLFLLSNDGGKTMRKVLVLSFCLLFALSAVAMARQAPKGTSPGEKQIKVYKPSLLDMDRPLDEQGVFSAAQPGTTWICPPHNGTYTFDSGPSCVREGWTSHDITEQTGCYWHVADGTELDGGDYGGLIVLAGSQSLWCGADADPLDPILCGYGTLPGYGNGWDQGWCFDCIVAAPGEIVTVCYDVIWDSEPGYDFSYVEYAASSTCDSLNSIDIIDADAWIPIATYDGVGGPTSVCDTIPPGHAGSLKIRFHFNSDGAWSDEDGLWNTDGAIIIDEVTVAGVVSGTFDYENFEDESPGDIATTDGDWECCVLTGYGDYAGLYPGLTLLQEDPCQVNLTCMWAFINGTTVNYACGGHPEQDAVPYVNARGQYITNEIWSPQEVWHGTGSQANLQFDVYRDLPLDNLIFYVWHVRSIVGGCPGQWRDRNFVYYGGNKDWIRSNFPVGDLIDGAASHVQVAVGTYDMCPYWCIVYGTGACHSHSPLVDNVEMYRVATQGPQWSVRDIDLFQDVFPTNGTSTGTGRIDMALDRLPSSNPGILPGDSAKVLVSDPVAGLGMDTYTGSGAAVYCYISVDNDERLNTDVKGQQAQAPEADALGLRFPWVDWMFYGSYDYIHVYRMDTCFTRVNRDGPVEDAFCMDLNDNYFLNGDTVEFWFGAKNSVGQWTYWSQGSGTTEIFDEAEDAPMEMQILPGEGVANGGTILYVDNFSGRGGQPYFDSAFQTLCISRLVDRFDKRGPSSLVGNAIGHRVTSVANQLHPNYQYILWNSGDLSVGTVGDGTDEKADDYAALFEFLDQHPNPNGCGIYFSGDDLADELNGMTTASSQTFKNVYIPHQVITGDHTTLHRISPYGIGEGAGSGVPPSWGTFDHGPPSGVDTIVVFGGCPIINDFDVVAPLAHSTLEMCYDPANELDDTNPAVIQAKTINTQGNLATVVLSGFSYHYIRNDVPGGLSDRDDHLQDILRAMGYLTHDPTVVTPTSRFTNSLAQNYPNPFNPSTTIKYSVKDNAHVSLKIYNVAGQLVRTLVNSDMKAGAYTEIWNGRSDSGNPVSSGVYFYKLVTKNFTMTKKMVLLK
jgi:membrane-bound inhibitor of C-type lysozyme